jgi:integrase
MIAFSGSSRGANGKGSYSSACLSIGKVERRHNHVLWLDCAAAATMPCHHALVEALRAYIDAAGIAENRKGWLFRTARGHNGSALSAKPMSQPDAWRMIRRRAAAAGSAAPIGCHTFRATGITAYLANGAALQHAQEMAAHESPRTTKLYNRTKERLTQDEVERIRL